ncbi:MAG: YgjV family protein [Firmicutes bacterium]|nr:YgjV family protein [Bacillota bacterium]MDY3658762.1 YgjV family protein [Eubacteriales bacterium]
MDLYFILSQIFGGVAVAFACLSYFCNKKNFLLVQTCANMFFAIGFFFVGGYLAFVVSLINALRSLSFYFCQRINFKFTYIYLIYFIVCASVATGLLWTSPLDIMPFVTSVIFSCIYFIKNMQLTRYLTLAPNTILSIYSAVMRAYTNSLLGVVEILFTIVSIVRYVKKNKKDKIRKFDENADIENDKLQ